MGNQIEFKNISGRAIWLPGPNGEKVQFTKFERKTLPEYYRRYIGKYLTEVRNATVIRPAVNPVHAPPVQRTMIRPQPQHSHFKPRIYNQIRQKTYKVVPAQPKAQPKAVLPRTDPNQLTVAGITCLPQSDLVGVAILSYNRLHCIRRLVESIREKTDMSQIRVFILDESTDQSVVNYLNTITDMTVFHFSRVGIAGNSNRAIRCLAPFKYKLLLNDDVTVQKQGWHKLYFSVPETGIHHFCMRQAGVYGATKSEGKRHSLGGAQVWTISEKPQGAVLAFDNLTFSKVGFFDEDFGIYGLEHVDWSERVSLSGIQPMGYHDLVNSDQFFKIHDEHSAVENRGTLLSEARRIFDAKKANRLMFINPRTIIENKRFSILIATLASRKHLLDRCLAKLLPQITPEVEILIHSDEGQKTTGRKRSELINFASGKYVAAVDDDDLVSDDYVRKIINATNIDVDCCSLEGIITFDGSNPKKFIHSLKYSTWFERDNVYYRCPNHLSPVRRSLAAKVLFADINIGEDKDYSDRLLPLLKTEASIQGAIYNYLYVARK